MQIYIPVRSGIKLSRPFRPVLFSASHRPGRVFSSPYEKQNKGWRSFLWFTQIRTCIIYMCVCGDAEWPHADSILSLRVGSILPVWKLRGYLGTRVMSSSLSGLICKHEHSPFTTKKNCQRENQSKFFCFLIKKKKGNSISRCIESTGVSPFTRTYDSIFFLTSFTCPIQIGYTLRYWARLEIAMGLRFLSVLRHRFSNVLSCGRTNDDLEQVARSLQDATGGKWNPIRPEIDFVGAKKKWCCCIQLH